MTADALAHEFTEFRPRLLGIAYRMLGSAWDAEDVVAEAMVRWMGVDREQVREPLAFLTTVVTRLAIDQLRSARATRETYVGEWLPEPVVTDPSRLGPLDTVERRETVSLATLRMMEALTPPERAVLVLHEAFDLTHAEIADILGISEEGARQHLRRARRHLDRDAGRSGPAVHDERWSGSSPPSRTATSPRCRTSWPLTSRPTATAAARPRRPAAGRRRQPRPVLGRCAAACPSVTCAEWTSTDRRRPPCGSAASSPCSPSTSATTRSARSMDHEPGQAPIPAPPARRCERSTAGEPVVTASIADGTRP